MTIENPTELDNCAISLVGQEDACNLAAVAGTEKKLTPAVPTGKVLIVDHIVMDEFSADNHATPPVLTFGKYDGDCDEFLGDQTLSNITAAYATEAIILRPVPAATPVVSLVLTAGQFFAMEITQANGAALTARVSVFGHYKNA
jgi:hypothetical protein